MVDDEIRNLQILGAYRENEVDESHPLSITLNRIKSKGHAYTEIALKPLSEHHIGQIISDAISDVPETVTPLAALVYEKTQGNPFFIHQFIESLVDAKLIRFDSTSRHWEWNMDLIQSRNYTDNVIDFIVDKIGNLSGQSQELLKTAACIGTEFNLFELASVFDDTLASIVKNLWNLLTDRFIIPFGA